MVSKVYEHKYQYLFRVRDNDKMAEMQWAYYPCNRPHIQIMRILYYFDYICRIARFEINK